jgi:maleylacetate reductase
MHARRFTAQRSGTRIVFATGCSATVADEADGLGVARVLLVCSPRRTADAAVLVDRLGSRLVGTLPIATEHVPAAAVELALEEADRTRADALLALGGGSALGLGKAVAAARGLRLIAVPTTYSGSEMTAIYGVTEGGRKRTARDERVRPSLVLYDPALTTALPIRTSVESLWNAMAHCVEALWWPQADPLALLAAEHGLVTVVEALPALVAQPTDAQAREQALLGAYLAGVALGETGTALQHKLAHLLGGSFGLPHGATHAVLLPHVVRYNAEAAPEAAATVARVLQVSDPAAGLHALAERVGAPTRLDALGFSPAYIDAAIDKLLSVPMQNPRKLERAGLRALLAAACGG